MTWDYVIRRYKEIEHHRPVAAGTSGAALAVANHLSTNDICLDDPDFTIGDYVYVTRKGWTTDRPSVKLDRQLAGPYKIIGMKRHSYVLELPENMKMNNVFHADRLRKDPHNPLPGQEQPPEDPVEVNGFPEDRKSVV